MPVYYFIQFHRLTNAIRAIECRQKGVSVKKFDTSRCCANIDLGYSLFGSGDIPHTITIACRVALFSRSTIAANLSETRHPIRIFWLHAPQFAGTTEDGICGSEPDCGHVVG